MRRMDMIKFGIIGTSWISSEFIKASQDILEVEVTSVYSRNEETGQKFAKENNINDVFVDYEQMLMSNKIDAVYIGSPNAMHFEQALLAIKKGKHVICEKAITSNLKELDILIEKAKEYNVLLIEAVKSLSMPIFEKIKKNKDEIGPIRQVVFNFCQYSSKYNAYKKGEIPNIFNPEFSAGALMDIGVYCVYPCVALFGTPKSIKSQVTRLESGVDGAGSIILAYEGFEVTLIYSKINASFIASEIMGEEGSLIIHRISSPDKLERVKGNGEEIQDITPKRQYMPMYYEIKEFVETLKSEKRESKIYSYELMREVMTVLEAVRRENGIVFPADN